jgi:Xaa-Pro dipeptidase
MLIANIQEALSSAGLDGWLFFDHHHRDPLAYRVLSLPLDLHATRRWYYLIPATGSPQKLVHRIESGALDALPGESHVYSSWREQQNELRAMLSSAKQVAMQYSPNCSIPYVSMVDAGTVELVRAFGANVVSSADLLQNFEARWTESQYRSHVAAGKVVDQIRREAFDLLRQRLADSTPITEFEIQQFILTRFSEREVVTDHGPIVAVNANASDPHYEPSRERNSSVMRGDVVLIDLWAKSIQPGAVYYDVTWTGYCGHAIPDRVQNVFEIVRSARKRASSFVSGRAKRSERIHGFEVDDVARTYIDEQGYAEHFFHRTGHSIGTDVHGTGANMDNWESHDDRLIVANTCFSIEPGIYLPDFGIRSEVNVYVGDGFAHVTGEEQEQLILI